MGEPAIEEQFPDVFRPGRWRGLFVAAAAIGAFLLPQEIPLEWYPLNNPGTDINYLEISCAANVTGAVEIRYDLATSGHRPIDTISWPISPSTQTYTYTFPLPDAPIVEMHVLPPKNGELTIKQIRIINRRNEEIRRFTYDLFRSEREIAAITPTAEGWKLISAPGAASPSTRIELFSPIIPVGKDHRNLLRCLLSTGYLSLMLWILLLAVLFTFHRPRGWRDLAVHLGFMACLALMFAVVGNRGLIRNSIHYARYVPLPIPPSLRLEFDLVGHPPSNSQVFWDSGNGANEAESVRQSHELHRGVQTLRFPLPTHPLQGIRFDPRDSEGSVQIRGIRLVDASQRTRLILPLDAVQAGREIARLEVMDDTLMIETTPGSLDCITQFSPKGIELINQAIAHPAVP